MKTDDSTSEMTDNNPLIQKVTTRLNDLLKTRRDEQPEKVPPAAGSLNGFLAFLAKNPGLAYPDIVLTSNGNVRAEWTQSPDEHFAIEFREDEDVRFVIFAPDPKHPDKISMASGTATIDSVMGLAEYYRVSRWVSKQPSASRHFDACPALNSIDITRDG